LQLSDLLLQTTVLLRLEAGSTEAGFLAAFCPVSQTPTLVVIQYVHGMVYNYLANSIQQWTASRTASKRRSPRRIHNPAEEGYGRRRNARGRSINGISAARYRSTSSFDSHRRTGASNFSKSHPSKQRLYSDDATIQQSKRQTKSGA
jgi:hypothetical protein